MLSLLLAVVLLASLLNVAMRFAPPMLLLLLLPSECVRPSPATLFAFWPAAFPSSWSLKSLMHAVRIPSVAERAPAPRQKRWAALAALSLLSWLATAVIAVSR
jgi:hypothetical protein